MAAALGQLRPGCPHHAHAAGSICHIAPSAVDGTEGEASADAARSSLPVGNGQLHPIQCFTGKRGAAGIHCHAKHGEQVTEVEASALTHRCTIFIVACEPARSLIKGLYLRQMSLQGSYLSTVTAGAIGIIGTVGLVVTVHHSAEVRLWYTALRFTEKQCIAGTGLAIHAYAVGRLPEQAQIAIACIAHVDACARLFGRRRVGYSCSDGLHLRLPTAHCLISCT